MPVTTGVGVTAGVAVAVAVAVAVGGGAGVGDTVGVAVAALLLAVENSLVRPGDYRRINVAFFTLNGVVSIVLAATVIADVLLRLPTAALSRGL